MARRFFLHLYMLRIPVLILMLLGGILPAAFESPMFHGLADLEPNQVLIVSLGTFLLLSAAMACAFLVLLYGSDRVDGKCQPTSSSLTSAQMLAGPRWIVGAFYLIGGLVYLRFLAVVLTTMKAAHVDPQGVGRVFWNRAAGGMLGTVSLDSCQ